MKPQILISLLAAGAASAADWPMWGGTPDRNMVGTAKNLPVDVVTGEVDDESEEIDLSDAKNVLWTAKLGSQTYGICSNQFLTGTTTCKANTEQRKAQSQPEGRSLPFRWHSTHLCHFAPHQL